MQVGLKIKCNGVYHTRLVTCGYSQVPGVNYSKNYFSVLNEVLFRILLLMMISCNAVKLVNNATGLLCGELEEKIYMKCSPRMKVIGKNNCMILGKCIYGMVQAEQIMIKRLWK